MEIDAKIARKALRYEPEIGLLYWRSRPLNWFAIEMHGKRWNTKFAGKEAFTATNAKGYRRGALFNKTYFAHTVIWLLEYGEWPDGQIDHKDGNPANNRLSNLRIATPSENMMNRKIDSRNTSGVTGVTLRSDGKAWCASVKHQHLGSFTSFEDAAEAAREARAKLGFSDRHGV